MNAATGSKIFLPVALCLLLAPLSPDSLGQAKPRPPVSAGHLERFDNPPAPIVPWRREISRRTVSTFNAYTSYQVNVDGSGNNIVNDAANEPSISVDPNNPNHISIGWRQFDNVASNFRQGGWAFSQDGGQHWTFPGVLESGVFRSDPVLTADTTARFFYLSLLQSLNVDIWGSNNGGIDWAKIAPAVGGDKQWYVVDNSDNPSRGFLYQAWSTESNPFGLRTFSRSTDGGVTWQNPVQIPNRPIWGTLDIDTNGNVFVSGMNADTFQIWCERSSNARNGAVVPTFDQSTAVDMGGDVPLNQPINFEGLVGQINLAIDRSGTSTNNNVYMLASLQRHGTEMGSDVMFVRSTDGGLTFSTPIRVNDDPLNSNKWHWLGALAVAPNGRLDCVWLDTRNAVNNTNSQLFYSSSDDGGLTWSANVPVSATFNPFIGYPNQNKMGDYITVVSDNVGANVAYTATFNGEEDVYYVYIPAGNCAPNCPPAHTIALSSNPAGAGALRGGGRYLDGSEVAAVATALNGYGFNGWTENGAPVSSSVTYDFTIAGDRNLVANFIPVMPTVATPAISPAGGTFKKKVSVSLSCATTGATIHYTTDGSDPTPSSPVFTTKPGKKKKAKLTITGAGTHTVKAMAMAPGYNNSAVAAATFTIQ